MVKKIEPLDKTVVTEFKIVVADINLRKTALFGSVAARIPQTSNFTQGDANVISGQSLLFNNIQSVVAVYSFEPVLISLSNASGEIKDIPCSGLFVMYAPFDSVEIKAPTPNTTIRLTYLYA